MPNLPLSLLIIAVAIASIPIVLGLFLLAFLFERVHGGNPVRLTPGMDFRSLGMLADE